MTLGTYCHFPSKCKLSQEGGLAAKVTAVPENQSPWNPQDGRKDLTSDLHMCTMAHACMHVHRVIV